MMQMDFDPANSLKLLEEDRREYLKSFGVLFQSCLNRGDDDLALESIVAAAESLGRLNGSIQYLEQLTATNEYPRFNTIL